MEDTPGMEGAENRVSRRRMIQRIGAGTALAWSAPALQSLASPAHAQASPVAPTPCPAGANCDADCGGYFPDSVCGQSNCAQPTCICDRDTEGNCFCWNDAICSDLDTCTDTTDCQAGYRCFENTCCGQPVCLPNCGVCPSGAPGRVGARSGATASGR